MKKFYKSKKFLFYLSAKATLSIFLLQLLLAPLGQALAIPETPSRGAEQKTLSISLGKPLRGGLRSGQELSFFTSSLDAKKIYSLSFSLLEPVRLGDRGEVFWQFEGPEGWKQSKRLHIGDSGIYFTYQPLRGGPAQIQIKGESNLPSGNHPFLLEIRLLELKPEDTVQIEREPNDSAQTANPIELGRTVYATADDIEYLYNQEEGKVGWDWFRFDYTSDQPRLCFFELDVLDRDIPVTIKVYKEQQTEKGTELVEYKEGMDPTEVRHDDQDDSLLAYKFVTRVLTKGRYYLQVKGNHPSYQLRTALYDVPPYKDPRKAVEVAMRYMVDGGDSFFHNTPRKGAVRTRAENVTDETERCITCHPAHFTMLSTLTAASNGYPIVNKPQFKFMMDKLYNAMAPFYGHDGAYWLRFDLAPTNGISRLGDMLILYENFVSQRKTDFPLKASGFIKLVYQGRKTLPQTGPPQAFRKPEDTNFEHDGNRPISDFRVCTDSWIIFNELYQRTGKKEYKEFADHLKGLMTTGRIKDLEDIVEQTKGMVLMGDPKFKPIIQKNIEEIWKRQHDDGGWVTAEYMSNAHYFNAPELAKMEKKSDPSLTFFTFEVIYTLVKAGVPPSDPRIQKALNLVLPQQKNFGGWLDGKGELFLTPYLETKWAIICLSTLFPYQNLGKKKPTPLTPANPTVPAILDWLDNLWGIQNKPLLPKVLKYLRHPEPLVREMAAAALGKIAWDAPETKGLEKAVDPLIQSAGDPVKMVNRAAAWSLRQLANLGIGLEAIHSALADKDNLKRRGVIRTFYQYFYHVISYRPIAEELIRRATRDPDPLVRIYAMKALWRWWYRTTDFDLRYRILDAFLDRAKDSNELVRLNVSQAMYNILDENTVQFHGNWLRVIAREEDKQKAEEARQNLVEKPLARKIALALAKNDPVSRDTLLTSFGYHYLRGGIGNDYDFITFYNQEAARTLAQALIPLLSDLDPGVRQKAVKAAVACRLAKDANLVLAMMKRVQDPDPQVRLLAMQGLSRFPTEYQQVAQQ